MAAASADEEAVEAAAVATQPITTTATATMRTTADASATEMEDDQPKDHATAKQDHESKG